MAELTWEMRVMLYLNQKKQRLLRQGAAAPAPVIDGPELDYAALIANPPVQAVGGFGATAGITTAGPAVLRFTNTGTNDTVVGTTVASVGTVPVIIALDLAVGQSVDTALLGTGEPVFVDFQSGAGGNGGIDITVSVLDDSPVVGASFPIYIAQVVLI